LAQVFYCVLAKDVEYVECLGGFEGWFRVQKLHIISIVLVCALVVYAFGVATNFFANEAFSMFHYLSYSEAHSVALFLFFGVGAGLVLSLLITLVRKRVNAKSF
jgi:hypothetical protein